MTSLPALKKHLYIFIEDPWNKWVQKKNVLFNCYNIIAPNIYWVLTNISDIVLNDVQNHLQII